MPQAVSDTQYNVKHAARLGASLAFSRPSSTVPLVQQTNTHVATDNALIAATRVGTPSSVKNDGNNGSLRNANNGPNALPMQTDNSMPNGFSARPAVEYPPSRGPSPSNIAARLAAVCHNPSRPRPHPNPVPIMSERQEDERDILPPLGSVDNVLARFEPLRTPQSLRSGSDIAELDTEFGTARRQPVYKMADKTPASSTASFPRMLEHNLPTSPIQPAVTHLNAARRSPPLIRSPKPQRVFSVPRELEDNAILQRTKTLSPPPLKPKPQQHSMSPPLHYVDDTRNQITKTLSRESMKSPSIKPKPLQLVRTRTSTSPPKSPSMQDSRSRSALPVDLRTASMSVESFGSPDSFKSAEEYLEPNRIKLQSAENGIKGAKTYPALSIGRSQPRQLDMALVDQTTQPKNARLDAPVLMPTLARNQRQVHEPARPLEPISLPTRPASTTGVPSSVYHNKYQRQSIQQVTQHLTGESLSSAIVGAALASSSRNPSPVRRTKPVEPLLAPPPRKQARHHTAFRRSPSPLKKSTPKSGKMKTTMRKDTSLSNDNDKVDKYKKKGTRIMGLKGRKHPNKHQEGTRRRWRDQITERERKRYEGVWAANKGAFAQGSLDVQFAEKDASLDVVNIAVQEIWVRSRLPMPVLEEVWDLVDGRGVGRLNRYEFVVGLWLIDQRLKGRKLPIRVSQSVWDSARGVNIRVKSIK